jgi:glucosamine kinase
MIESPFRTQVRGLPGAAREPRYLVGVDGGGTSTRLRLCDAAGNSLASASAGPSALGQGHAQAWTHVLQALRQAAAAAGLADIALADCAIGLGLSGMGVREEVQAFLDGQPGFARVALDSDGFAGVLGAHGGQAGAVLVSGTGSIGEALRRDGSRACVGGWGWAIGDEGSGAWLGRRAVQLAQCAVDGRVPRTALAEAVLGKIGSRREDIVAWCAAAGQSGFASLAPLVFEAVRADARAVALLDEAVDELEQVLVALDPQGELPLVLSGSVAEQLAPRFSAATRTRCVAPCGDAAAGAMLLLNEKMQGERER